MHSLIVKDVISELNLQSCLTEFFQNYSVSRFDPANEISNGDILFEMIPIDGNFKLELCLYTEVTFSIELVSTFICKWFKTDVLISDASVNPFSWILLNENGLVGTVYQEARGDNRFEIKL
jgi:hypothetical protein